ncbi:unnamed protein product [Rotaria sordida]|uniref:Septin-type G domain-containing protein n=1 Tax=Rotaria sordida TaxID=392033 RepID=A0A815SN08_9BILA|nr:unnamed protein product [Rotaria sordida]CAF1491948.1 unnamed protein product [Rotaria sordida]
MRFFYADREQRLSDDPADARKCFKSKIRDINATHIVAAISFGIDVVIVLQLPPEENTARKIDIALAKIRTRLKNRNENLGFTEDDANILQEVIEIKVYSNVTELTKMTSLLAVCQFIDGYKQKRDTYRPVEYTLRPIEWLFPDVDKLYSPYTPLNSRDNNKLEQHLIENLNYYKKVKYFLDSYSKKALPDYLKELLIDVEQKWQNLQKVYEDKIKQLTTLMLDIRNRQKNASEIDEALKHNDQTTFKENIRELLKQLKDIKEKTQSINTTQEEQFQNNGLFEPQKNKNDNEQTLKHTSTMQNQPNQTLCSNDQLSNNNQSILSTEQKKETNRNSQCSSTKSQASHVSTPSSTNEIINILLLGESGVGKSTFINAFVNYLTFKMLNDAERGKPIVLIPVSFLMTIGNNFNERIVKFGDSDNFNNEDFDHPGQSVTQHCKSYVFHLNSNNKRKLRIIDTPGFGDTRGLDQDDANMQHILEYINELTHLNAICFLLKPNTSQINSFFVKCLTQLFDLLGSNARQNIIFCFTNARSTFYTPGDTAPLLKSMLQSFSLNDIPFKKENTFCFDNESFRYLVARQNQIGFTDEEHNEYENSWSKSVTESNHLLRYVSEKLCAYVIQGKQQSIKQTQLQISHMIRPMLEAMRNILRNLILWNIYTPNKLIELNPIVLHRSAAVCYTCQPDVIQRDKFWIAKNLSHEIRNTCYSCKCASDRHIRIDYELDYTCSERCSNYSQDEIKKSLTLLLRASVEFAYFLMNVARSSKDDPFLIGIVHMIDEESNLCACRVPHEMNLELVGKLKELMLRFEQYTYELESKQDHSKLHDIYTWIQTIYENPMVRVQMDAIKQSREIIMKQYECEFSNDPTNTTIS